MRLQSEEHVDICLEDSDKLLSISSLPPKVDLHVTPKRPGRRGERIRDPAARAVRPNSLPIVLGLERLGDPVVEILQVV